MISLTIPACINGYLMCGMTTSINSRRRWQCIVMFIELIVLLIFQKNSLGRISSTMDLWSYPNLALLMAVTAHWIEVTTVQTSNGPQHLINLHSDLIVFYHVTGHHNGECLATVFMEIFDHIGITDRKSVV